MQNLVKLVRKVWGHDTLVYLSMASELQLIFVKGDQELFCQAGKNLCQASKNEQLSNATISLLLLNLTISSMQSKLKTNKRGKCISTILWKVGGGGYGGGVVKEFGEGVQAF